MSKKLLEQWLEGFIGMAKNENDFELRFKDGIISARIDGERFALFAPEGLESVGVNSYEELKKIDPLV